MRGKNLIVIRHVEAEHLGLLGEVLPEVGLTANYIDVFRGETVDKKDIENSAGIIILGGYMGVYETEKFPFLRRSFSAVEDAISCGVPVLGVCLGAQIIAHVLGSRVFPGKRGKEIGWFDVVKVNQHPLFSDFPERFTPFHWHGDTFDLPRGAVRVFSSEKYENQGFVWGKNVVGLQFHIEITHDMVGEWAKLYEKELKREGIPESELIGKGNTEPFRALCLSLVKKLFLSS